MRTITTTLSVSDRTHEMMMRCGQASADALVGLAMDLVERKVLPNPVLCEELGVPDSLRALVLAPAPQTSVSSVETLVRDQLKSALPEARIEFGGAAGADLVVTLSRSESGPLATVDIKQSTLVPDTAFACSAEAAKALAAKHGSRYAGHMVLAFGGRFAGRESSGLIGGGVGGVPIAWFEARTLADYAAVGSLLRHMLAYGRPGPPPAP